MKIRRRIVLLLGISASCCCLGLSAVFYTVHKKIHQHNDFLRILPPHAINKKKIIDLGYNSYYIAGIDHQTAWLGNFTDFTHVLKVDLEKSDTQHIRIKIANRNKFQRPQVRISGTEFFVLDGILPGIYTGSLNDGIARPSGVDSVLFSQCVPLGINTFAFSFLTTNGNTLARKGAGGSLTLASGALTNQKEGYFSTDGMMSFDASSGKLVYGYYYRNEFIVLDTTMRVIFRGRTIDTVSVAKIKVDTIRSEHSMTMAAPPLTINKLIHASGNRLYVWSPRMARKDIEDSFAESAVIDVYALTDGRYEFSFYIPRNEKKKLLDFAVTNDKLMALFDHYLILYDLNNLYFNTVQENKIDPIK